MQTLVINQGYMPLYKTSWQNAIVLCCKGKARIVQTYKKVVYAAAKTKNILLGENNQPWSGTMPKVIRLIDFVLPSNKGKKLPLSKGNLYNRDSGRCGYCLRDLSLKVATIDHVIPTSRGGKHVWENVAISCRKCNEKKADQIPEEAGMKLKVRLHAPPMDQRWIKGIEASVLPTGEFVYSF